MAPPMSSLRMILVPDQIVNALARLNSLPAPKRKRFLKALNSLEVLHAEDVPAAVADEAGLPKKAATEFLAASQNMHRAMQQMAVPTPDFVEELGSALARKHAITEERRTEFQAELASLLNSRVLNFVSKVTLSAWDQQHLFLGSRILTDIRPIFDDEQDPTLQGIVMTHTLRLSYRENGEDRDFYVTLDPIELVQLRETVERALRKQDKLHQRVQIPQAPWIARDF